MGELSPWHWIVVLLIFALLFGSKKLPDAARGLGRSMRIFKAEMQVAKDEFADAKNGQPTAEPTASSAAPVAPVAPLQDAVPPDAVLQDTVLQDAVLQDAVPQPVMTVPVMHVTPEPVKPAVEI